MPKLSVGEAMDLRFNIDPETGLPHIYRHGIEEYEVEDVLDNPIETTDSRDNSRVVIGQTRSGRYLLVAYRQNRATDPILVITAYQLRGNDLARFRRRQRRRGR